LNYCISRTLVASLFSLCFVCPMALAENKTWLLELRNHARNHTCPEPHKWDLKWSCQVEAKCENIESCEEAFFKLLVCGHYKRDGGYKPEKTEPDGVPCERKCKSVDDDLGRLNSSANFCPSINARQHYLPSS